MFKRWRDRKAVVTLVLLVLLAGLLPTVVGAHDHATHMAGMTAADAAGPSLGAGAAFDAQGHLWVVTARDGHVLLRESDDFGKRFSAPVQVNAQPEDIQATSENRPQVVIGPQGQVYVAWAASLGHWVSDVRFARSLDGGRHFSAPITVNHDQSKITHSFATLVLAGNGDPVIAWLDSRGMAKAMAVHEKYRGLAVYYSWSSDDGASFAADRRLMDHSCECCRIALAREPDGGVAAFFRAVYGDNIRDHAFGRLSLDGQPPTMPGRATFSQWQIAACPEQGPGLAIGADGTRHAVWYEGKDGPHIWYGQLRPGRVPAHRLQVGGAGASHADVAVDGAIVRVVWNQVDAAAGYKLMERVSHDGGVRFGPARVLAESAQAVYSPFLLRYAGRAYVAWNTADGFRLVPADGEGQ